MTTQVTITVKGSDIIGQNKESLRDGRDRLTAQEQQSRDAGASAGLLTEPGAVQTDQYGRILKRWRWLDQTAATPRKKKQLAHAFAFAGYGLYKADEEPIYTLFFSCADVVAHKETITGTPVVGDVDSVFTGSYFALPVNGTVSIIVLMARHQVFNSEANESISRLVVNRAYLVSRTALRQLTIPQKLQDAIDVLNPQDPNGGTVENYPAGEYTSGFAPRQIRYVNDGINPYGSVWLDCTPKVYEVLNTVAPFVSPSLIRQYPRSPELVVVDWRTGYGSPTGDDWSLHFALWNGDPNDIDQSRPDLLTTLPDSTIELPYNWQNLPLDDIPGGATFGEHGFTIAWDWGIPDYCRQMLLALGFTPADLTP